MSENNPEKMSEDNPAEKMSEDNPGEKMSEDIPGKKMNEDILGKRKRGRKKMSEDDRWTDRWDISLRYLTSNTF